MLSSRTRRSHRTPTSATTPWIQRTTSRLLTRLRTLSETCSIFPIIFCPFSYIPFVFSVGDGLEKVADPVFDRSTKKKRKPTESSDQVLPKNLDRAFSFFIVSSMRKILGRPEWFSGGKSTAFTSFECLPART